MRAPQALVAVLCLVCQPAHGEGERAGDFDYYVLSLSWQPSWCERTGDGRGDPQCDAGQGMGWMVHGLWPQFDPAGWPEYCRTTHRDPTRGETAGMADIMGGAGLAFYEWKKHGRCSGLSAPEYYQATREAMAVLTVPELFDQVTVDLTVPASVIEEAFLEANPDLAPDQITITCNDGLIAELRLCLTGDLEPRRCGEDVIRDCRMPDAALPAIR